MYSLLSKCDLQTNFLKHNHQVWSYFSNDKHRNESKQCIIESYCRVSNIFPHMYPSISKDPQKTNGLGLEPKFSCWQYV